MAKEITVDNFESLKAEGKPMVIDFWATWCGPCRMVSPIIDELSEEYKGQVIIGKIDVDENNDLAVQFGVRNIPTILFFNKEGEMVNKLVGAQQKAAIVAEIQKIM
ncbi:thioredoxin [Falsiporphyromonas endometrii]|uniref:Thioredoxin n=1 Tax=Falsiporphyromonas endometrii TaxID=1387297 RepID=A0ABV9K8F1_9PORP